MIYWCEGGKNDLDVCFINSDSVLLKVFLHLFRKAFEIDESKFRVCVHLHQYHNREEVLDYWSKATAIPRSRFIKPFLKENTGKRKKDGYMGCVSLRYFSTEIARELLYLMDLIGKKFGRVA